MEFRMPQEDEIQRWWKLVQHKVDWMIHQIGDKCPHATENGVYDHTRLDWWTSGFWPGILWIVYDMTKEEKYQESAWLWDERIEKCFLQENRFHHDVGFQFLTTSVIKYKVSQDSDAKRRGLQAANFLAGRFNLEGRFIRAWNQPERQGWSIIDTMMNLSILFWASTELNDPRFAQIAIAHADTVQKYTIRDDGTSHHITVFDAFTGQHIGYEGGQGYAPDSSWSRGQAWAIYGFANACRHTGYTSYLKTALRVADSFISCLPSDAVSHWDFSVPNLTQEPRDTSATSIAASGLLEIAEQLPAEEGVMYRRAAVRMLQSLTERYSALDTDGHEGILLEGTGNKPIGMQVNVSLIYGDYYYVEALAKLAGWKNKIF
jgi:unsaturated chondroitin disaccharide hydrolase